MPAGAVLAGGASRRMGRDKALVPWDGVPMVGRVARALSDGGCAPVTVIGGDMAALTTLGLHTVPDLWPGDGPLGGVITALRAHPDTPVVVVACDMPDLSPHTVAALVAALGGGCDVAVAVTDRSHPLCAAWSSASLPTLEALFERGIRRMSDAIATLRECRVSVPSQDVRNVNAPSDLAQ